MRWLCDENPEWCLITCLIGTAILFIRDDGGARQMLDGMPALSVLIMLVVELYKPCRIIDSLFKNAIEILNFMQAYIEAENMRLESDPCQFSDKEIVINIEYKYCPNLTIIDTPGLIIPAPGRKNRVLQVFAI